MDTNRGMITTYAHGVLDYLFGLALLLAPNIFGFSDVGGAVEIVPRILGIGVLAMALLTNYELGLIKAIPFRVHRALDIVGGLYLGLSPFIHGFSDAAANMWVPHIAAGAAIIIVGMLSRTAPSYSGEMRRAYS